MLIHTTDESVRAIALAAFPAYRGRTFSIRAAESVSLHGTYWDGGSRNSYALVDADGRTAKALPHYAPPQFGGPREVVTVTLPEAGGFIVEHSIFCGRDHGLTVYAHPSVIAPLLPAAVDLTEAERRLLILTSSLTSAGRKHWRERAHVSRETWDCIAGPLKTRGLLAKGGGITNEGRNAVSGQREKCQKWEWKGLGE